MMNNIWTIFTAISFWIITDTIFAFIILSKLLTWIKLLLLWENVVLYKISKLIKLKHVYLLLFSLLLLLFLVKSTKVKPKAYHSPFDKISITIYIHCGKEKKNRKNHLKKEGKRFLISVKRLLTDKFLKKGKIQE